MRGREEVGKPSAPGGGADEGGCSEGDLGNGAFGCVADFKEIAFTESEQVGDQVARENLELDVEIAHIAVIEAAGRLDFIFRVRQLRL